MAKRIVLVDLNGAELFSGVSIFATPELTPLPIPNGVDETGRHTSGIFVRKRDSEERAKEAADERVA